MPLPPARYLQHFWIHGKHYGTAPRTTEQYPEARAAPRGKSFFCSECGDLWAQCPIEDTVTGLFCQYAVTTVPCSKHHEVGQWLIIAGTLYQSWDKDFTRAMPEAVLRRELDILLKNFPEVLE